MLLPVEQVGIAWRLMDGLDLRHKVPDSSEAAASKHSAVRRKLGILSAGLFLAYTLGVAEYWHFAYWHSAHINDLYNYQNQLLKGHAPWIADQNRILAPLLIECIQRLFGVRYGSAYQYFMYWSFIGMNICALALFRQCGLRLGQIVIGLLLTASAPLLLFNYWWFPWTNLEAMLFLMAFAVDASYWRRSVHVMALGAIFLAMVLTKESCVFLPIWLFLRYASAEWMAEWRWGYILQLGIGCFGMVLFALAVDAGLRHWLWVSGTLLDKPSGSPPSNLPQMFGTHIFLLDYPALTLSYLGTNLLALAGLRLPWPLIANPHWTNWPTGSIDFFIVGGVSVVGSVFSFRDRDPALFALTLFTLAYLAICFLLINLPESDKFMPALTAGAYAFARYSAPSLNPTKSAL